MKKKTKWILGSIAALVALLCLSVFVYYQFFFTFDLFQDDGPTETVNQTGWSQLGKGLTKDEVIALLGDTSSKHRSGNFTIDERTITYPDYWEYDFTAGGMSFASLHGAAHPKAYVVAFNTNGHLFSWREPLATNVYKLVQTPEQ